jgi:hypothetical protein
MASKQLGFGDFEQTTAKKRTKRERFLSEMEKVVPWKALIEVPTIRRSAGIDMIKDRIPDETTILAFRHLLEKHDLGQQIFRVGQSPPRGQWQGHEAGHDHRHVAAGPRSGKTTSAWIARAASSTH